MISLESTFYTVPIKNPIVIGSSGISDTARKMEKIAQAGAGAVVMKSVFEEEIEYQFKDELKKIASMDSNLEYLDYFDYELRKHALTDYCDQIREAKEKLDIPIIASICCKSAGEWVNFAGPIEEAGADALEVNAFFLPIDENQTSESYEQMYVDIIVKLKEVLEIPVGIKIGPYFSHLPNMVKKLAKVADGITLFNRFYNPDIQLESNQYTNGHIFSGPADYHNTLRWTAILSPMVGSALCAGCGIHKPETVVKMLLAGAGAVQVVSGVYLQGLSLVLEMVDYLENYMDIREYETIEQFRGKLATNSQTQNHLERTQFMKYFGGGSSMIDI